MEEQKDTRKGLEILISIKNYIKELFDLRKSKENEDLTVVSIRNGVVFKGTNLWVLIFAIFIGQYKSRGGEGIFKHKTRFYAFI